MWPLSHIVMFAVQSWFCSVPMVRSTHALLFFLLLILCFAEMIAAGQPLSEKEVEGGLESAHMKDHKHRHSGFSEEECPGACTYRCSKTAHKKPCMFFCQKCCLKCRCVPPGTYGHKQVCPCYNNWKTKRGGPKCP